MVTKRNAKKKWVVRVFGSWVGWVGWVVGLVGLVVLLLLFLTVLVFIFFLAFLCWFLALRIERKASDADAKNLELVNMSKTPSIAKLKKGGRGKKKKKASVDLDVPGKGFRFCCLCCLGCLH